MADNDSTQISATHKLEALGQFAGGIAHDFNNILSVIEWHAHIAAQKARKGETDPDILQKITAATQRGAALTRQLLAFSRQNVAVTTKINLIDTLREQSVLLLKPSLGGTVDFQIEIDAPADMFILAAPEHLTQIFLNLAINARDAMPDGGAFSIAISHAPPNNMMESGGAVIRVRDTGEGMPPDVLRRVFEPFFTTKEQGKGTGLGLSIVLGIVEQLGGRISAMSEPGQGTVFDIVLPLYAMCADDAQIQAGMREKSALQEKTVLIVEDEDDLRDVLCDVLRDKGMRVIAAANGEEALQTMTAHKGEIDFMLTDIIMPKMDGVSLGTLYAKENPKSNVIYMSGYPFMEGRREHDLPKGATFLQKPVHPDVLLTTLIDVAHRKDSADT